MKRYVFRSQPGKCIRNRRSAQLYCTPKALWKLNWFLRDFGYDTELLGRDELDDKNIVGLSGVVKITHSVGHFLAQPRWLCSAQSVLCQNGAA